MGIYVFFKVEVCLCELYGVNWKLRNVSVSVMKMLEVWNCVKEEILVVKELVERDFWYVKECLNGGGLFGKVRELFRIHKEYFWRGLVSYTCFGD